MDQSENNQKPAWKRQVNRYYEGLSLSEESERNLESLLLGQSSVEDASTARWRLVPKMARCASWIHRSGVGYLLTAATAAVLVFVVQSGMHDDGKDPIEELTATSAVSKAYPPDFDLEGDPGAFREIVQDLMPAERFNAEIPLQVQAKYAPADGRFFSWEGDTGVRINLVDPSGAPSPVKASQATLYIVRLSDKQSAKFPTHKVTRKVAQSGKEKRIKAWREGKYGYALVQYVATSDQGPNAEDSE